MIFDGLAIVYSTCRHCDEIMQVVDDDRTHPNCPEKLSKAEVLARRWLTAVLAGDDIAADLTAAEIAEMDAAPPRLHDAAMQYAKWGWPVFPLAKHSKVPAIPKRRGGNGVLDATTDLDRVDKYWTKHPDHNIGIATGKVFDVLDVDPDKGGHIEFLNLLQAGLIRPVHGVSVTASGGMHLLYRPNSRGNATKWHGYTGLDWRGEGGYIVAPPSTLGAPGRAYSWMAVPSPRLRKQVRRRAAPRRRQPRNPDN